MGISVRKGKDLDWGEAKVLVLAKELKADLLLLDEEKTRKLVHLLDLRL